MDLSATTNTIPRSDGDLVGSIALIDLHVIAIECEFPLALFEFATRSFALHFM